MISSRRGVKYAGKDAEAMFAITSAASHKHNASWLFGDMAASVSRNVPVTASIIVVARIAVVTFHTIQLPARADKRHKRGQ